MKCRSCNLEKPEEKNKRVLKIFGFKRDSYHYLCEDCSRKYDEGKRGCDCCKSATHENIKGVLTCEDWIHKVADGLRGDILAGRKEEDGSLFAINSLGCVKACEHYEKYVVPILKENCSCCGWVCVDEEKDDCYYLWCGGEEGRGDKKCRVLKTCERFWEEKEKKRVWGDEEYHVSYHYTEISKKEFYSDLLNKPKDGFECSHFLRVLESEIELKPITKIENTTTQSKLEVVLSEQTEEEKLRTENELLQERVRELEQLLAEAKIEIPPKK